jgi:hypothetical protein
LRCNYINLNSWISKEDDEVRIKIKKKKKKMGKNDMKKGRLEE